MLFRPPPVQPHPVYSRDEDLLEGEPDLRGTAAQVADGEVQEMGFEHGSSRVMNRILRRVQR